jgi:hypothetical protein
MEKTYKNLKQLLNKPDYSKYGWHICGDLKVVSLLMGLQLGYMKYCHFLCEWDSQTKTLHYLMRDWPQRKSLKVGEKDVQHPALAEWHKILLLPLHIKLGLIKKLCKSHGLDWIGVQVCIWLKNSHHSAKRKLKSGFL